MIERAELSQIAKPVRRMTKADEHAAFVSHLKNVLLDVRCQGTSLYTVEMERWRSPSGGYYYTGVTASILIDNPSQRLRQAFKDVGIWKTGKRSQWRWEIKEINSGKWAHELMAAKLQALFSGEARFRADVRYVD